MVLQQNKNISLLELLESHAGVSTLEVAVQTQPPTPLPAHPSPSEQAKKKRKRDKKGKEVPKEGEVVPSKELKPQQGAKISKGAQERPQLKVQVRRLYPSIVLGFQPGILLSN